MVSTLSIVPMGNNNEIHTKLTKYVQINQEEESIARSAPWQGKPAIIASDGLFGFGKDLP